MNATFVHRRAKTIPSSVSSFRTCMLQAKLAAATLVDQEQDRSGGFKDKPRMARA